MLKISIIVPVYNVEKYLRACLESLVAQTLKEIEIICVNDASTDASLSVLEEYSRNDERVKICNLPENSGTLNARIQGVKMATGRYLMFVDSDDYMELQACEKLYEVIEREKVDIVHFGTCLHTEENVSNEMVEWVEHFLTPLNAKIEHGNLVRACFTDEKFDFNITNKIWRREVCEQAFAKAKVRHLVASEDRYIFFMLACYAESYFGTDIKLYHYNLGIGVTGGDVLSLEQFEKRCSGIAASELVKEFLISENITEKYGADQKKFSDLILWDCIDCWHNKLTQDEQQEGFLILQKYFKPDAIMSAIARVYFEQADDIDLRAGLHGKRIAAIYYRYLGYQNMDVKVRKYAEMLKKQGYQVLIYTDNDRYNEVDEGTEFGAEIVYLPNSVDANWDKYEVRANKFLEQICHDKVELLLYASPTSHIHWLDVMLLVLSDIAVVDLWDEVYLDEYGRERSELQGEVVQAKQELVQLKQQLNSPGFMFNMLLRCLKKRILHK